MNKRRTSTEDKLEELDDLHGCADDRHLRREIETALSDRHYRIVAKAAVLCADRLLYDLIPQLVGAYERFLEDALKRDRNCIAKNAIARALVMLDYPEATFFVAGLRYRQLEPSYGGRVDSAVDLRCVCAMGLVATPYPRALIELVTLLHDPEALARIGAVRAIACGSPSAAELVLRSKVLAGDEEAGVLGECFLALLRVQPDESVPFVADFLRGVDGEVRELAALALGESRLDDALAPLQAALAQPLVSGNFGRVLLRAVALHRSEQSLELLFSVIRDGSVRKAVDAVTELSIYRYKAELKDRLRKLLSKRANTQLTAVFEKTWVDCR